MRREKERRNPTELVREVLEKCSVLHEKDTLSGVLQIQAEKGVVKNGGARGYSTPI